MTANSPGAKAAGVGPVINLLLTDCREPAEQKRVVAGLKQFRSTVGDHFSSMSQVDRENWLRRIDAEARAANGEHYFSLVRELSLQAYYFYERYRFADESTIAMRGFEDSTFRRPNDSATIVFRGGVVTDRGKAQWSATRLDANGIDFAPVQGATNEFSWNRVSPDKWTASIRPASGNPTVYQMERVRRK